MAFLHLNFDNFESRDLGHSDFLSFKILAPTRNFINWKLLEFPKFEITGIFLIRNFLNFRNSKLFEFSKFKIIGFFEHTIFPLFLTI